MISQVPKNLRKVVVLLSGGLDSTTCLAKAVADTDEVHALTISYGQRHQQELEAAKRVATDFGVASHRFLHFDLAQFGGSSLTDASADIPTHIGEHEIPSSYVPARNTLFLSAALSFAEAIGAEAIFIGVSAVDYSNYPDCRPEFIAEFEKLIRLATKAGVEGKPIRIETPLMHLSKAETIELGLRLGVDYSKTVSCYQVDLEGKACGTCLSCQLRRQGFAEANLDDPTPYQEHF